MNKCSVNINKRTNFGSSRNFHWQTSEAQIFVPILKNLGYYKGMVVDFAANWNEKCCVCSTIEFIQNTERNEKVFYWLSDYYVTHSYLVLCNIHCTSAVNQIYTVYIFLFTYHTSCQNITINKLKTHSQYCTKSIL